MAAPCLACSCLDCQAPSPHSVVVQPLGNPTQLLLSLGLPVPHSVPPEDPQSPPAPSHSLSEEPEPSHHPAPDLVPVVGPPPALLGGWEKGTPRD